MSILSEEIYNQTKTAMPTGAIITAETDTPSNETAYYFDIITNHGISVQNQITDNYLENNTAVQDHIAHTPITISLSGISGELKFVPPEPLNKDFAKFINKLDNLSELSPVVSNATKLAMNIYDYASVSAKRYSDIASKYKNSKNPINTLFGLTPVVRETRLQEIFRKLKLLRDSNTQLIAQTPYGTFENMYIQSITLRQENVNFTTDIELTLKQLQFAEVKFDKVDESVRGLYNAVAQAQQEDNGKLNTNTSLLKSFFNKTGAFGMTEGSGIRY